MPSYYLFNGESLIFNAWICTLWFYNSDCYVCIAFKTSCKVPYCCGFRIYLIRRLMAPVRMASVAVCELLLAYQVEWCHSELHVRVTRQMATVWRTTSVNTESCSCTCSSRDPFRAFMRCQHFRPRFNMRMPLLKLPMKSTEELLNVCLFIYTRTHTHTHTAPWRQNPMVHHRVQNSLPPVPILSQFNPPHIPSRSLQDPFWSYLPHFCLSYRPKQNLNT
jgi:hypothetical protein